MPNSHPLYLYSWRTWTSSDIRQSGEIPKAYQRQDDGEMRCVGVTRILQDSQSTTNETFEKGVTWIKVNDWKRRGNQSNRSNFSWFYWNYSKKRWQESDSLLPPDCGHQWVPFKTSLALLSFSESINDSRLFIQKLHPRIMSGSCHLWSAPVIQFWFHTSSIDSQIPPPDTGSY